jgi:hypothetical protein
MVHLLAADCIKCDCPRYNGSVLSLDVPWCGLETDSLSLEGPALTRGIIQSQPCLGCRLCLSLLNAGA